MAVWNKEDGHGLEVLRGQPIGELCAEHEFSQFQYYQWRDQFLANAGRAFEWAVRRSFRPARPSRVSDA